MTIGQKIAQLRKEHHLSQEELGNQLGVSRQAIYKWESDASLPEIEKLIALSRLFSVSVGWLLGVEDLPQADANTAGAGETDELTAQQLKMVEEITARYLEAQPKLQPGKWKKFILIGAILLLSAGAILWNNLNGQLREMEQHYANLENQISRIQTTVNSNISSISNRVEEILKSQNTLTASYTTTHTATDVVANTATFAVNAVPKTYTEGMRAVFCATQNSTGETTEVEGTLGEHLTFSAEIVCPLSDDITLSVTFIRADKKENQYLDQYQSLYSVTVPFFQIEDLNLMWSHCKNGVCTLRGQYLLHAPEAPVAPIENEDLGNLVPEIKSFRPGLFLNQKLVAWAKPVPPPSNYANLDGDFYALPDLEIPLKNDDVLTVAVVVVDCYDREFICIGDYFMLDENNDLIWPQHGSWPSGTLDPAGWTY